MRRGGLFGGLAQLAVDEPHHANDVFVRHRLRAVELFGQPHGAELGGVDRFDQLAGGDDDFGAAAADVGQQRVLAGQIEPPPHALERQTGLLVGVDDLDRQIDLLAHAAAEFQAVGRLAHGARGDGPHRLDAHACGDRLESPQRFERGVHRLLVELAARGQRLGKPRRLALFVEHAVAAAGLGFGHDQADAVAADVDGRQPRVDVGGDVGLLVGHRRRQSMVRVRTATPL